MATDRPACAKALVVNDGPPHPTSSTPGGSHTTRPCAPSRPASWTTSPPRWPAHPPRSAVSRHGRSRRRAIVVSAAIGPGTISPRSSQILASSSSVNSAIFSAKDWALRMRRLAWASRSWRAATSPAAASTWWSSCPATLLLVLLGFRAELPASTDGLRPRQAGPSARGSRPRGGVNDRRLSPRSY